MLTPVHCRKRLQWACDQQNWTMDQWKTVVWSDECFFFNNMWTKGGVTYLGKRCYQDALWEGGKPGGSMVLWEMFCWETLSPAIHVEVT